jgi:hypothetical protein
VVSGDVDPTTPLTEPGAAAMSGVKMPGRVPAVAGDDSLMNGNPR